MPIIKCPYGCGWESDNLSDAFAAVLAQQLSMHDKAQHSEPAQSAAVPQKLKIDPPQIGLNATPEVGSGPCIRPARS